MLFHLSNIGTEMFRSYKWMGWVGWMRWKSLSVLPIWAPLCGANDIGRHQFDMINNLLALPLTTTNTNTSSLWWWVTQYNWGKIVSDRHNNGGKRVLWIWYLPFLKFEIIFTLGFPFSLAKIWSGHVSVTCPKCLVSLFLFELYLEKKWTKLLSNFFQYLIFQKFL